MSVKPNRMIETPGRQPVLGEPCSARFLSKFSVRFRSSVCCPAASRGKVAVCVRPEGQEPLDEGPGGLCCSGVGELVHCQCICDAALLYGHKTVCKCISSRALQKMHS